MLGDKSENDASDNEEPLALMRQRWADVRRTGRSLVRAPGTTLIVVGVMLTIEGWVAFIGLVAFVLNGSENAFASLQNDPISSAMCVIAAAFGLVIGPIITIGGYCMRQLRSYKMAMTASLLTIVSGILCSLFFPFGIWPLVVLLDSNVQRAFEKSELPGEV